MRNHDGVCLSVPWQQTDLPRLSPFDVPHTPRLSLRSWVKLAQHLQRCGPRPRRSRQTISSG
jgi:hypothetical protein